MGQIQVIKKKFFQKFKFDQIEEKSSIESTIETFTGLATWFNYPIALNNDLNSHLITERRTKSQRYGHLTGVFPQMPVLTGEPVFRWVTFEHWNHLGNLDAKNRDPKFTFGKILPKSCSPFLENHTVVKRK